MQRLIDSQFPRWSGLPVTPVAKDGQDNRTYRLGRSLTARLPTAAAYEQGVAKEDQWLAELAPALPLEIPSVKARGQPGQGYPYAWSVRGWIPGATLESRQGKIADWDATAVALGQFIQALQKCDTTGGPVAGAHCWFRGCSLHRYHDETMQALAAVRSDSRFSSAVASAVQVWAAALAEKEWEKPPVWFHGDLSAANLLVGDDGNLVAVIDFGTCGVGDPACDLVPAWTVFAGSARRRFKDAVAQDAATWARARGWALWKGFITLADATRTLQARTEAFAAIGSVIQDHQLHST